MKISNFDALNFQLPSFNPFIYKELMLTLHHDEGMGREKTEYGKILCLFTKIFLTLKFIKKISQATRNNKLHKKSIEHREFYANEEKLQIFTQKFY